MIRGATIADVPRLVEMAKRFHGETVYSAILPFSDASVEQAMTSFIGNETAVVFVMEAEGEIVGAIGGIMGPHFVSGTKAMSELFWWVDPEHRGSGSKLLSTFEKYAKECGASFISMIAPPEARQVEKLYDRMGYHRSESIYMKDL